MNERLYTITEAAAYFGVKRDTIYRWMRLPEGQRLRYVYVGTRRRIPQSAVDAFVRPVDDLGTNAEAKIGDGTLNKRVAPTLGSLTLPA
jgi:excisionase family DNA binding protein